MKIGCGIMGKYVALDKSFISILELNVYADVGTIRPEGSQACATAFDVFDSLIASFGSILCYWHHWVSNGVRISTTGLPDDTIAQHFLRLLHQKEPQQEHIRTVDISLILYAV